jgi:hypothetical protein
MLGTIQSTVVPWEGDFDVFLPDIDRETAPWSGCDASVRQFASAEAIAAFPWDGGRPQECYDNVTYLVDLLGGERVYGWALADSGPLSAVRQREAPLYARWINHAVWRDGGGKLWEVTPRFEVGNLKRVAWSATRFVPDAQAVFHSNEDGCWSQPARYVAVRPEGERLARLLCRAEVESDEGCRANLLRAALAELARAGFIPKECRVETTGTRTNNIWLIVE